MLRNFRPSATLSPERILSADTFAFCQAGSLTRLPRGTEFKIIGEGFNDRTVKALSSGATYFIFLRDIDDGADHPVSLYS